MSVQNKPNHKKDLFILNLLLFLTFDLMILGSIVRTMSAGLTCPDWPLCFGKIIPEYHFGVYLEFLHRVIAGLIALIYLVFFFQVLKKPGFKKIRFFSVIGLLLLIAQIIMGGLTVLKLLAATIVTFHLALGTAFLFILFLMKKFLQKNSFSHGKSFPTPSLLREKPVFLFFKTLLGFSVFFVFVQIVLGGLTASTYSGAVCIDFPTCNGEYFPELKGPIGIQMLHRFGAYLTALLITLLFIFSTFYSKKLGLTHSQRVMTTRVFFLIYSQILVGVMNLKYLMPAFLSVFHLSLALIILLSLTSLYLNTGDNFCVDKK